VQFEHETTAFQGGTSIEDVPYPLVHLKSGDKPESQGSAGTRCDDLADILKMYSQWDVSDGPADPSSMHPRHKPGVRNRTDKKPPGAFPTPKAIRRIDSKLHSTPRQLKHGARVRLVIVAVHTREATGRSWSLARLTDWRAEEHHPWADQPGFVKHPHDRNTMTM
jgi:hypothetical protein